METKICVDGFLSRIKELEAIIERKNESLRIYDSRYLKLMGLNLALQGIIGELDYKNYELEKELNSVLKRISVN